jgi:hypothetical protein
MVNVKAVSSERPQNKVDDRFLEEADVYDLNVREGRHELEPDAHESAERDVLEHDRDRRAKPCRAELDGEYDLRVCLVRLLAGRDVREVVRGEGDAPVHHDDVVLRLRERADLVDPRRLVPERERGEPERVEERGRVRA